MLAAKALDKQKCLAALSGGKSQGMALLSLALPGLSVGACRGARALQLGNTWERDHWVSVGAPRVPGTARCWCSLEVARGHFATHVPLTLQGQR